MPTDVLSPNHAFDGSAGAAEVTFVGGMSPQASYTAGTCNNVYCHGNGQGANGTVTTAAAAMTCASCHPGVDSGRASWQTMSGAHSEHIGESNIGCSDCHGAVTADNRAIVAPALHMDRQVQINFAEPNVTMNPADKSCSGTCHGKEHNNLRW